MEKEYHLPQRDPEKIENMFNSISKRYDLLNFFMSYGLDSLWRKRLIQESQLKGNEKVLDLACGTGDISFAFEQFSSKKNMNLNISGTDFSLEMIKCAKEKAKKRVVSSIDFKVGDALNIDAGDSTIDIISIGFALRNLADLKEAFKEMSRVLKPGGRAFCLDLTRPKNRIMKWGHSIFLRTYVPFMGICLSGNYKAYSYLSKSIREFPPPDVILKTMEENGFSTTKMVSLSGGISTIFIGEK